jgi:hypothetical protein
MCAVGSDRSGVSQPNALRTTAREAPGPEIGDEQVPGHARVETRVAARADMSGRRLRDCLWSDTGSATAGEFAAALMLATSGLLASAGRPALGHGALAGVGRAFRALRDGRPWLRDAPAITDAGLAGQPADSLRVPA